MPSSPARSLRLLTLGVLAGWAVTARAQEIFANNVSVDDLIVTHGQVFWNSDCANQGASGWIQRAPAAGGPLFTVLFVDGSPCNADSRVWSRNVAADPASVFWINAAGRVVATPWSGGPGQPLADTESLNLANLVRPLVVAGDQYVFWVEHILGFQGETIERSRVFRATKDGRSGRELVFDLVPYAVTQIAALDDTLFVLTTDGVLRRGTSAFDLQTVAGGGVQAFALGADTTNTWGSARIAWSQVTSSPSKVGLWSAPLAQVENSRSHFSEEGDASIPALAFGEDGAIFFQVQRSPEGGPILAARESDTSTVVPSAPALRNLGSSGRYLFWRAGPKVIHRFDTRQPLAAIDLAAVGIEVIQAVQNSNNDVPLVAGKPMAVRFYARIASAAGGLTTLPLLEPAATLRAYPIVNGQRGAPLTHFGQSALPARAWANAQPKLRAAAPTRNQPGDSLWFYLPEDWTRAGTVELEAVINPARVPDEVDFANNTSVLRVNFLPAEPLRLAISQAWYRKTRRPAPESPPVHTDETLLYGYFQPAFVPMFDRALALLPASSYRLHWYPGALGYHPYGLLDWEGEGSRLNSDLAALRDAYLAHGDHPLLRFCAIIPNLDSHIGGLASGKACWWKFDLETLRAAFAMPEAGTTMAHELGHTFGRAHVNCGKPDTYLDPSFPYANECWISGPLKPQPGGGTLEGLGWDPVSASFIPFQAASDFMSYGSPAWVSDYTWKALLQALEPPPGFARAAAPRPHAGPSPQLYVRGIVLNPPLGPSQFTVSHPVDGPQLDRLQREFDGPGDRDRFELRAFAAQDQLLATARPVAHPVENSDRAWLFAGLLALDPATVRVDLVEAANPGAILAQVIGGGAAPTVNLLQPLGGETIGATLDVRWNASDPDGHALHYVVHYSHDAGQTWLPLAVGQTNTQLVVETANLPGGAGCRVQVLASDGILSSTVESGSFSVPRKAPAAYAGLDSSTHTNDTGVVAFGDRVILRGLGFDPENGHLDGERLGWSVTGPVAFAGTGERLELPELPPGNYTAALTATDHDGNPTTAQTTFRVAAKDTATATELPRLDGYLDDAVYATDTQPLRLHYATGELAFVANMPVPVPYPANLPIPPPRPLLVFGVGTLPVPVPQPATRDWVAICLDPDRSGGATPQSGDVCFRVYSDGQTELLRGTGTGWELVPNFTGFDARVARQGETWSAEFQIDAAWIGGVKGQAVGMSVGHHDRLVPGDVTAWPPASDWTAPRTWGEVVVGDPPPANDAFANATALSGPDGETTGTNRGATTEASEPVDFLPTTTVWWRWQPTTTTNAFFEITDATFAPALWVYRGTTLGDLALVAYGAEGVPPVARGLRFHAEAGVTYWIRIGGERAATGDFTLRWGNMPIPIPNPVAWYPFTGNANDLSGGGHHGDVVGPTLTANRFGQPDAAYRFTGAAGERIELPPAAFNPREAFTVALWAKPADHNGWHMLFTKWDDVARRYFIHVASEGGRLQFSVSTTGTDFGQGLTDPTILPLNLWTHCVAVANGATGELKLYRNGQLAAARTLAPFTLPDLPDTAVRIGGKANGSFSFNGVMDDVLYLDRALADADIADLFASQLDRDNAPPRPASLDEDFSAALAASHWTVISNAPSYTAGVADGAFRVSRPAGGVAGFAFAGLEPAYRAEGDYEVRVDFREAQIKRVNGAPGNQIQLNLLFGGQNVSIVRSDETAPPFDNVHAWVAPPQLWFGALPWTATHGTLRIKRSGTLTMAFIDETLVHLDNYNTNAAAVSFALQNNGTTDATAVAFDNFRLVAERLVSTRPPPAITDVVVEDGKLRFTLTTPDADLPVRFEMTTDLGVASWQEVGGVQINRLGPNTVEAVMQMPIPVPKPGEPLQAGAWFYRGTLPVPPP